MALDKAGLHYKREHKIDFACIGNGTFARIDFLLILHGHFVFLEVDEGQHTAGYGPVSCDMRRMSKVLESLTIEGNTLPIIFVRYNPHTFSVDGCRQRLLKRDREDRLISILTSPESTIYNQGRGLTIQYMYFDMGDGIINVLRDPDYHRYFAECCVPNISK